MILLSPCHLYIRFCHMIFYVNFSNFLKVKICCFDTLPTLLSPPKDEHFSFFQRSSSCQLGFIKFKELGLRRHSDKISAEILPKYLAIYFAVWQSLKSAKKYLKKNLLGVHSPWWNSFLPIGREVRFLKQVVFIACL